MAAILPAYDEPWTATELTRRAAELGLLGPFAQGVELGADLLDFGAGAAMDQAAESGLGEIAVSVAENASETSRNVAIAAGAVAALGVSFLLYRLVR